MMTEFFTLNASRIAADGYPKAGTCTDFNSTGNAGTGGFIYMKFVSILPLTDQKTQITADGGTSCGSNCK